MVQQHLNYKQMTDYGCFYTPKKFVDETQKMILKHVTNTRDYTLLDTSCGYCNFLENCQTSYKKLKANDIDLEALKIARATNSNDIIYCNQNALSSVSRQNYGISEDEKLIIIGNPPYNDTTSITKHNIKNEKPCDIDQDIKTRDLGISFLLSYNKLHADYIAVLHPLSYLIKYVNFKLLSKFYSNYSIVDSLVINSQEFLLTSKTSGFPIVIILYKRDPIGTSYKQVISRKWQTIDGKKFFVNMDSISNYISKYPIKNKELKKDDILFYTMRDINALKRSKTFINRPCQNAIIVDLRKLEYYCYVDVFKDYISHIPYFLGNCDVFIDNSEFQKIKDDVLAKCAYKYPYLKKYIDKHDFNENNIMKYFKELLGENFI